MSATGSNQVPRGVFQHTDVSFGVDSRFSNSGLPNACYAKQSLGHPLRTVRHNHLPGQATCEGRGFLPIILRVSSSLVASIQFFLADKREVDWNVSPRNAENF